MKFTNIDHECEMWFCQTDDRGVVTRLSCRSITELTDGNWRPAHPNLDLGMESCAMNGVIVSKAELVEAIFVALEHDGLDLFAEDFCVFTTLKQLPEGWLQNSGVLENSATWAECIYNTIGELNRQLNALNIVPLWVEDPYV